MEKGLHLPPHRGDRRCIDSLAQQVEHIPFKDGVLGSSPRRITGVQMNKKAKAFHSWTDPQWKAFFRVFSFMSSLSCLDTRKGSEKKIKAPPGPGRFGRVPGKLRAFGRSLGTRQTWLASLTPLDARKGSEKKIKASSEAVEVWPGTRQIWLASLTPLDARKGSEKKVKASPRPGKFGRVPGKLGWRP